MADKGEAKSYKSQSFNTTEGGLFCGYVQENNAKFAVALRRILPSPNNFKTDHYIALQMNGEYDGAIQMNAPSVLEMKCGEKPIYGEVAGLWYAENGDIVLNAPNGTIRLLASNIELISDGNPDDGKGNVSLSPSASLRCEGADQIKLYGNETRIKGSGVLNLEGDDEVEIAGGVKITERADIISGLKSLGSSRSPKEFIKNLLRFTG